MLLEMFSGNYTGSGILVFVLSVVVGLDLCIVVCCLLGSCGYSLVKM